MISPISFGCTLFSLYSQFHQILVAVFIRAALNLALFFLVLLVDKLNLLLSSKLSTGAIFHLDSMHPPFFSLLQFLQDTSLNLYSLLVLTLNSLKYLLTLSLNHLFKLLYSFTSFLL